MDEDGTLGIEQRQCLLDTAPRLQQGLGLVRDTDVKSKVIMGCQIVNNLIGEMMHVHHHAFITSLLQFHDHMPKQRLPPYPDQRLRHRIGQGFQSGSKSRRKDHRLFHACKGTNKWAIFQKKAYFFK